MKKKKYRLSIRFTKEQYLYIKTKSELRSLSKSDFVRSLLINDMLKKTLKEKLGRAK